MILTRMQSSSAAENRKRGDRCRFRTQRVLPQADELHTALLFKGLELICGEAALGTYENADGCPASICYNGLQQRRCTSAFVANK
mmetsp:Transcript_66367/g.110311  ORF Transcript_66367/g.110311 Transcript_66367/m.110311 type:complete len:85 (-) Transcript_66367:269-523(-)